MARRLVPWLQRHDHGYVALRRAGRVALVAPGVFAIGLKVLDNSTTALFASFGSVALLMLVNFTGATRSRLEAQAALSVIGGLFICVGTLTSRYVWLAVLAMGIVAFVVIFLGVVSSVIAGATTAMLLAFILPDTITAPASQIPERLAGWGLASGAAFLAVWLLWPSPTRTPLRVSATNACRSLAARLTTSSEAEPSNSGVGNAPEANDPVGSLQSQFLATPWRPSGLGATDRAIAQLVDEISWTNTIISELEATPPSPPRDLSRAVHLACADVLNEAATLLETSTAPMEPLEMAGQALKTAIDQMERHLERHLSIYDEPSGSVTSSHSKEELIAIFLSSLETSFRSREVGYAVMQIATNVERAVLAERRGFFDRLLGHEPGGTNPWESARSRISSHFRRHSVWLHNSVRGAIGLGLAVLVAEEIGVEHTFWVILGTLSVLRSNALNTGQNALRAVEGTVVGFIIGALLVIAVGTNITLLWLLFPVAFFAAAFIPTAVSFAAGQAAFTLAIVFLFNILAPVGWRVGLVRVEDVAIGCAVSACVSLLLWPRGAASELGTAMREAYLNGVQSLTVAVEQRSVRRATTMGLAHQSAADLAAASAVRLDDAFRSFVVERGPKPAPLSEVTTLISGVALLQLSADAINDLWSQYALDSDLLEARECLASVAESVEGWYDRFTERFQHPTPTGASFPAQPSDEAVVRAVRDALMRSSEPDLASALVILWIADHLKVVQRLEPVLDGASRVADGLWIPHHFEIRGGRRRTSEVTAQL